MAKTNEAFDAFLSEVLANVPADKQEALKASLTDESIVGKLQDGFLRQSDYSRNSDKLSARQREIDVFLAGESEKVNRWKEVYEESITVAAREKELADKYRATYGDLKDGGTAPAGLRKEDVLAMLDSKIAQERGGLSNWMVDAVDKLTDLKLEHRQNFGTTLSTKELSDFAGKHNISDLNIAYRAFIEPQLEVKREASFKEKMAEAVKQAKEDARREAIAEKFPGPGSSRSMYSEAPKDAVLPDKSDRVRSAAADLEQAMAGIAR